MMDNYEAFFDEYNAFMDKMGNDSGWDDFSALGDYFSMLEKEEKMLEEMEAIDEEELSDADAAYYLEVTARIYQKLMKVVFHYIDKTRLPYDRRVFLPSYIIYAVILLK